MNSRDQDVNSYSIKEFLNQGIWSSSLENFYNKQDFVLECPDQKHFLSVLKI